MTADDVKRALRTRHPAAQKIGSKVVPGVWTCVEEWSEIDLLAISAYKRPPSGASSKSEYPRVGYEVKISRSDLRRELLAPGKRLPYHALCNELYLAVPEGLLTDAELAYQEPDWQPEDFERQRCGERCQRADHWMTRREITASAAITGGTYLARGAGGVPTRSKCPACAGKGYTAKSRVEQQAPTVWVPRDLGLVQITAAGRCDVVRRSPVREVAPLDARQLSDLVRWVSARPDPRHDGLIERARAVRQRRRRS